MNYLVPELAIGAPEFLVYVAEAIATYLKMIGEAKFRLKEMSS
jgi:hypothetical protein